MHIVQQVPTKNGGFQYCFGIPLGTVFEPTAPNQSVADSLKTSQQLARWTANRYPTTSVRWVLVSLGTLISKPETFGLYPFPWLRLRPPSVASAHRAKNIVGLDLSLMLM